MELCGCRQPRLVKTDVMTQIVLVRHAQTAGNRLENSAPMGGWTDLPLSATGWQQVDALRRRFRFEGRAAAIYSSPLQRTRHTASALQSAAEGPVNLLSDLREIHCGNVDGRPLIEVQRQHAALWQENQRQENPDFRWPGGESYREFRARTRAVLQAIVALHPGQRVLVVTHCGIISQLMGSIHGVNPARWEAWRPGNASITELEWGPHGPRAVFFDNRTHLYEQAQPDFAASAPAVCLAGAA